MSAAANCCNHKHTSHMTQPTPWRYLEKGKDRMGRAAERQERRRMKAGDGGGGRGEKEGTGRDCEKEDI